MHKQVKRVAYYEAFSFGPLTGNEDKWFGTGTLIAIKAQGLRADLSYPMYGDERLAVDGWACRAR
jgi:hypothetical protein